MNILTLENDLKRKVEFLSDFMSLIAGNKMKYYRVDKATFNNIEEKSYDTIIKNAKDKIAELESELELKTYNAKTYFTGMKKVKRNNRLVLDIQFLKDNFIIEDNKLLSKVTRKSATWVGTTSINITIDKVIYKASRICYAMTTGEDIVDTDIGYLNGDYNDYSFANLMKKGG